MRVTMMRAALVMSIAVLLGGCPNSGVEPRPVPRGPTVAKLKGALELPPGEAAAAALRALLELGEKGNREASWEVTHYLFDLYDQARLTGDGSARTLLWQGLGQTGPARRGAEATRTVVQGLLTRLNDFLRRPAAASARAGSGGVGPTGTPSGPAAARDQDEKRRRLALRLKALLQSDEAFLTGAKGLGHRLRLLKSERRGPTGYAAELRLYALCAQAFRVAVLAPPQRRPAILNHCLYPLFELDPAPHLKPGTAVPQPPWTLYQQGLGELLGAVAAANRRAGALASLLEERDRQFYELRRHRLPILLHSQARDIPTLRGGRPYRWHSALMVRPDQLVYGGRSVLKPQARHFRVALSEAFFAGNKQTHVTLFATTGLPMAMLKPVLERAAATGFYSVGFGGVVTAASEVGFWRLAKGPTPIRLREVPLSLAPISAAAATLKTIPVSRLRWASACDQHQLGVLLGQGEATAYGPDGRLQPVLSTRSTGEALLQALGQLRDAFPSACAVRIAATDKLSYAELLAALSTLHSKGWSPTTPGSARGWRYVGYDLGPPKPTAATFASRVQVRIAAKITLPRLPRRLRAQREELARRIRPCYLRALDVTPARWAELEVRSTADKTLVNQARGTSPEEISLNGCVADEVSGWRKARAVAGPLRFTVQLKP